jgi:hypothetical protein
MKVSKALLDRVRKLESEESKDTVLTLSNGGVIAIKPHNMARFGCAAMEELSLEESIVRSTVSVIEPNGGRMFEILQAVLI